MAMNMEMRVGRRVERHPDTVRMGSSWITQSDRERGGVGILSEI